MADIIEKSSCNFVAVDISDFLDALVPTLKPPVANRVWFQGSQFFAMIVGGPNARDDFHFQPGQELFYMIKGDMNLDIMEEGCRKKVPIAEGEMFLLPKEVHHSPQRQANTIGLVFERLRKPEDVDHLKWFKPETDEVMYEEEFHCSDINNALKPIIGRFLASPHNEVLKAAPRPSPEVSSLHRPAVLQIPTVIEQMKKKPAGEKYRIFSGEFVVDFYYGETSAKLDLSATDTFVWQFDGSATLNFTTSQTDIPTSITLNNGQASFLPTSASTTATITQSAESCIMVVTCSVPYP